MQRRTVLGTIAAGTASLAVPRVVRAQAVSKTVICVPYADLVSLDPPHAPSGTFFQPMAFRDHMQDVRDGWPQFHALRKAI